MICRIALASLVCFFSLGPTFASATGVDRFSTWRKIAITLIEGHAVQSRVNECSCLLASTGRALPHFPVVLWSRPVRWVSRFLMICRIALASLVCFFSLGPTFAQQRESTASRQGSVLDVGPDTSRPQPIFMPDPDYPRALRKRKIQGICVLGLTVDEHGTARNLHVMRSLDKRLDQNAIDAVKRWKFKPAMRDGKPVAVLTSVEVDFRLH